MFIVMGLVILCLVVFLALWVMSVYNGLIALNQNTDKAWANIDIFLKQRHDELGKLLAVCDGYKNFEKSTLLAVVQARQQYASAATPDEKLLASGQVTTAVRGLLAVAESYPDLKSNQNFIQLQNRISALETQIASVRGAYNEAVTQYNVAIQQFPAVLVAPGLGYSQRPLFQIAESDKEDVKIQFS